MKKIISLFVISAFLLSLVPAQLAVADNGNGNGAVQILYAGQDIEVGMVAVTNDAENIYVEYEITEDGWCITETHVHVGETLADFPLNRGGNPQIGQFDYKEKHDPCVTEYTETISLDWEAGDELLIAAHAVVSNAPMGEYNGVIYGGRTTGGIKGIYEIDVVTEDVTLLLEITGGVGDVNNGTGYTNALAYDAVNNILYFTAPRAVNVTPSPLYSYIPGEISVTERYDITGSVVGAAFYNGAYYYIVENTNELRKITDFTSCNYESVCEFGSGGYTFGDFVISPEGILYGSTRVTPQMFFSFDISNCSIYTEGGDAIDLQLAYGSNGKLYGTKHATGQFYVVDETTGMKTPVGLKEAGFADLASGMLFVPETETAWAAGTRFTDKGNWATYFEYNVQEAIWDVTGDWVLRFVYNGSSYDHDMTVTIQGNGDFEGTGGYPADRPYTHTWTVEGSVDGDDINFHIVYLTGNPGYESWVKGVIGLDGRMNGSWHATGQPGLYNWESLSGNAVK